MLLPTHLVTGQTAYLAVCVAVLHTPRPAEALVAVMAATLPDLDHRQSLVGRWFPFISYPLEYHFGHRSLTHSLLLQVLSGVMAWYALPPGFFLALMAGWVSHSWADMMTPSGVAWFWPSRLRCVLPGNERFRMKIMGRGELAFLVVMAGAGYGLMILSQVSAGTGGLIKTAIADIHTARQDYDAQKGANAWQLEITGRDNRSYGDISGSYPVIGPYKESGFILGTDEGPRSLCRNEACNWYAEKAVLVRGERQATTTTTFRAEHIRASALYERLATLQSAGEIYLIGTVQARNIPAESPTVEVSGEAATLNYAAPSVIRAWDDTLLEQVELVLQLRHAPGQEPPELPTGMSGDMIGLHPLLKKWVGNP